MAGQFLDAVKKGDRATVDEMLDADPSLASAKDDSGTSAVLLAHYYGKADVAAALESAELLLAYGADPNATDAKSLTPLDIARDRRNVEVAALLHRAVTNRRRI